MVRASTLQRNLSGEDVQTYKYWCFERQEEDNFESLVRWLEMRVQIKDEAWEETGEYVNRRTNRPEEQRRFNKGLPYDKKRKQVYCWQLHRTPSTVGMQSLQRVVCAKKKGVHCADRSMFSGHQSRDCHNAPQCGVDGCKSNRHSSYLHEHDATRRQGYDQTSQLRPET